MSSSSEVKNPTILRNLSVPNQYQRIVKKWMNDLGIEDVSRFSTHSVRKTKASIIYEKTKNIEAVRKLLGQNSVTATSHYLNVTEKDAINLAKIYNI